MDVRLLGQIEAVDGEPFALAGPTQRRVLAALALRRNEVVSIPHLVEVIWPDAEVPDRAEHNVRTYVHRLRSSLTEQGERIDTVGSGYRILLDDDELDLARFEHLAGTAKRLADTGEAVAALDLIDEAERLWRAPRSKSSNTRRGPCQTLSGSASCIPTSGPGVPNCYSNSVVPARLRRCSSFWFAANPCANNPERCSCGLYTSRAGKPTRCVLSTNSAKR
jgi:hypothetical protein